MVATVEEADSAVAAEVEPPELATDPLCPATVSIFKLISVNDEEMVAVKIRGLPYQVRYEEVSNLFKDYSYIEKSVVLGTNPDGRKNGFGAILFEDEKEAKAAMNDLQGEHIGERYVELTLISYGDYSRFNGP